ncbi:MAG: hypothetical protein WCG33_06345 [Actinomycetes bacterium]
MRSRSTISVFFAATLSGLLLLSSCGGSSTTRQRNGVIQPTIPTEFVRSTVCTNFYGAYQKDMAADNAAVTLRFCPDATRYELKWGEGESASFKVDKNDPQLVISGSDFISKGPLVVTVFRDRLGEGDSILASAPLGEFELSVVDADGESRLSGTWDTRISYTFLDGLSRTGGFSFVSSPLYLSYFFDQLIWFQRDRCRDVIPESESEAFNLEFKYKGLDATIRDWLGRAMLIAKGAQQTMSARHTMYSGYNPLKTLASNVDVRNLNAFSAFESCTAKVAPLTKEMSDEQKQTMTDIAPLLRDTIRKVDSDSCAANQDVRHEATAKILEAVPQFVDWRFSSEPDKAALEVAQFRLEMLTANFDDFYEPNQFHICKYRAWGQEVQDPQEVPKDALVSTFGAVVRTADGFTSEIQNYDQDFQYSATVSEGAFVSINNSEVVVTGLPPNTEATVEVGTVRAGYAPGSAFLRGSALNSGNTPTFGEVTSTADGFTVEITNYDPSFDYSATRTGGEVLIDESTGLLSVSGLAPDTEQSVRVMSRRRGFVDGSAEVTGSSLKATGNSVSSNAPTSVNPSSTTADETTTTVANSLVTTTSITQNSTTTSEVADDSNMVDSTSTVAPVGPTPDVVISPEVVAIAATAAGEKTEGLVVSPKTTEVVCNTGCVAALLASTGVADGEVSVVIGDAAPVALPKDNRLKLNVGSKDAVMKFIVTSPEGKETVVNVPVTHSSSVPEPAGVPSDSNTNLYLIIAGVMALLVSAGFFLRRKNA